MLGSVTIQLVAAIRPTETILFYIFFLFGIKKKKKSLQNNFVLGVLMATINWVVTEPWIDKNWKLENWIDKIES